MADPYSPNLVVQGFESKNNSLKYELITSFESFEHFVESIIEIESMIQFSDNILFSTELLPFALHKPEAWWCYALESGQHIHFILIKH